jgi:isopentenyl-diphosphate delta-isomerase
MQYQWKKKEMLMVNQVIADQVILVNENDEQIGVMDKVEAHRGEGKLHRASSVFLRNAEGKWLIQQRSQEKITCPGWWANTCCGNLRPGENYEECAQRRLKEELGIESSELQFVEKFLYFAHCNDDFSEREIDSVYIGQYDEEVKPNPAEVQNYKWVSKEELLDMLEKNDNTETKNIVPWLDIIVREKKIIKELL